MNHEQRLRTLERQHAADVNERMIAIAAAELAIDPEVLRADVEQLAMEARRYPTLDAHVADLAESLDMSVDDLAQTARRLEAAALAAMVNDAA